MGSWTRWLTGTAMLLSLASGRCTAEVFQTPEMLHAMLPLAQHMRIELELPEPRLCMQTKQSNPMMFGGGLIGALVAGAVDSHRRRSAENSVAAMRIAVGELPIEATLRAAIETHLDRSVFAPELEVGILAVDANGRPDRHAQSPATRVLVLRPAFCFDPNAHVLKFAINTVLENRIRIDGRLRAKTQYVVIVEYAFDDPVVLAQDDRDARMETWASKLDRTLALQLLTESINGAVDQLNDVVRTRNDSVGGAEKRKYLGQGSSVTGYVRREARGRTWMRLRLTAAEVSVGPVPAQRVAPVPASSADLKRPEPSADERG